MKKLKSKRKIIFALVASLIIFSGCEEDEILDLAKAQKCLDELPVAVTDWDSPITCANFVAKHNSQQANIIKCAAYLTAGGLDTARITSAAKTLDDGDGSNKEAVYIAALTLNKTDSATGLARANTAKSYCEATGVGAFIYLGSLAVMGTTLSNIGTNFPSDPSTATPAEIQAAIDSCQTDTSCISTIASSAETIASSYCDTASSGDAVCTEVNNAIAAAGGNSAVVGEAMLCLLENKTWANNTCT